MRDFYASLREKGYYTSLFPLGTFMMCFGFFFVYVLELGISKCASHEDKSLDPEACKMNPDACHDQDDSDEVSTIHEYTLNF